MTKYEYASRLMDLYVAGYDIMEVWYEGSRLLFHDVMENNDIACTVIHFEYDGNHQTGRYVIPFDNNFFVMNIVSDHSTGGKGIQWSIENE